MSRFGVFQDSKHKSLTQWRAEWRGRASLLSVATDPRITVQHGKPGAIQEYDAMEGQSLSVQCPYNTQHYKEEKKAWCRSTVQNKWDVLVNTYHGFLSYQNSAQKCRARIHDDTQKGIVTITMEKLKVDDAGVYWCARPKPAFFIKNCFALTPHGRPAVMCSNGPRCCCGINFLHVSKALFLWLVSSLLQGAVAQVMLMA
uniref:Ig-like domain-containing protein n=1 Tax=Terrapene triunguis TaxID=2587831 RepID=A0A674JBQ5_9SAUR